MNNFHPYEVPSNHIESCHFKCTEHPPLAPRLFVPPKVPLSQRPPPRARNLGGVFVEVWFKWEVLHRKENERYQFLNMLRNWVSFFFRNTLDDLEVGDK